MESNTTKIGEKVTETIKNIVKFMEAECEVNVTQNTEGIFASVYAEKDARALIGKNGQNLSALEHVVRAVMAKELKEAPQNIAIDINDYKKSKAVLVLDTAKQALERVRNTHRAEALAPMSSYERKVIHAELASCPDIVTESIGEGIQRRVVIKPYSPI